MNINDPKTYIVNGEYCYGKSSTLPQAIIQCLKAGGADCFDNHFSLRVYDCKSTDVDVSSDVGAVIRPSDSNEISSISVSFEKVHMKQECVRAIYLSVQSIVKIYMTIRDAEHRLDRTADMLERQTIKVSEVDA